MQSPYPDVILNSTLQWYPLLPREAYPPTSDHFVERSVRISPLQVWPYK